MERGVSQVTFLKLERSGELLLRQYPDENRPGVTREILLHQLRHTFRIKRSTLFQHQRGHTCPAISPRHFNAIDITDINISMTVNDFTDLVGGAVFALPAEGIANPVDELIVLHAHGKNQHQPF